VFPDSGVVFVLMNAPFPFDLHPDVSPRCGSRPNDAEALFRPHCCVCRTI
jgi:hypothetical protein